MENMYSSEYNKLKSKKAGVDKHGRLMNPNIILINSDTSNKLPKLSTRKDKNA